MKPEKSADGKSLTVKLVDEADVMNVTETEEKLLKDADGVTDLSKLK